VAAGPTRKQPPGTLTRKAKKRPQKSSSTDKGRIVETLAAWLHDWPGVTVETNARLPPLHDSRRRPAEIDVLLTTSMAGYPVRIAIECKNETKPIGLPYINSFIGKLDDVGIPRQQGIFVSASRYTKDAVSRAAKEGIRTLRLKGLSADGLKASITCAAYESIVFYLVVVDSVSLFTKTPASVAPFFVDVSTGRLCGTVPHLIASKWQSEETWARLGSYDLKLDVPGHWRVFEEASGRPQQLLDQKVHVKMKICALAMTAVGKAEQYALVDASSSALKKHGIKIFFDTPEGRLPLTVFEEQAELDHFLESRQGLRITQRIKVPRIRYHTAYWPLSRRAAERIREISKQPQYVNGQLVFPSALEVEGFDIAVAWEEPMSMQELGEFFFASHDQPAPSQRSSG